MREEKSLGVSPIISGDPARGTIALETSNFSNGDFLQLFQLSHTPPSIIEDDSITFGVESEDTNNESINYSESGIITGSWMSTVPGSFTKLKYTF